MLALNCPPYKKYEVRSGLSAEEALRALSGRVSPPLFKGRSTGEVARSFCGAVTANGFKIMPSTTSGFMPILPVVTGTIHAAGSGSLINITMRLPVAVLVCLAFLEIFLLLATLIMAPQIFSSCGIPFSAACGDAALWPAMMVGAAVLVLAGYGFEAKSTEALIRAIFEAPVDKRCCI